jgi:radical SAM superfamily enzyme YgiQ (UPF0313 family)
VFDAVPGPGRETEMSARTCNVLLVQPRFGANTFWNFAAACKLFGARYPTGPLGLITVAALLPSTWSVRLVDRNNEELTDGDLAWADLVMTGGMLPQQFDLLNVIDLCRAGGKPVAIGGPAVASTPEIYERANFRIVGEAEGIIDKFIAAWEAGEREGLFSAEKFKIDVTKSRIPRFDLLKFDNYLYIGVQFSRGCPFTCEFCDIIELYGRVPRTKTNDQILAELETLRRLGYRGHVDFVDDNLIGNKKAVKAFLPELRKWQEAHDPELLRLMSEANFVGVFVGIESPDTDTLVSMKKKQNTRRNLVESVHRIYAAGMYVTAGFIVGFDSEKGSVADAMVELIEDTAIPVSVVALLYALPNTQLTRRLTKEGRLHHREYHESTHRGGADACTQGLNFDTLRPRQDILLDYKRILEKVYDPLAFVGRLRRLASLLDNSRRRRKTQAAASQRKHNLETVHRLVKNLPDSQEVFWQTFIDCARSNPASARYFVMLMAFYLHLGPFSRYVIRVIEEMIEEIETGDRAPHRPTDQPALATMM